MASLQQLSQPVLSSTPAPGPPADPMCLGDLEQRVLTLHESWLKSLILPLETYLHVAGQRVASQSPQHLPEETELWNVPGKCLGRAPGAKP